MKDYSVHLPEERAGVLKGVAMHLSATA